MKLIVLAVVSIAVFRASCRERPNGQELNDVGHRLSDGSTHPEDIGFSYGTDHYYTSEIPNGPKDEATTVEPDLFSYGPVDHVSSTNVDMGVPTIEFGPELVQGGFENNNSSDIDHQLNEDGTVQNERKLRGGSKCKSDIVCSLLGGSCVSNSTYCSGREVPSVCGGAKCKCCITVNLEVKVHDLETELRSMAVNLTVANANLNTKLEAMMNFMISSNSSQSTVSSNLDQKIDSLMSTNSNLTQANSHMKTKLESMTNFIISANTNQSTVNTNLDLKIDSVMSTNSNLTAANLQLKRKLESMTNFIISANSNQSTVNSNMDLKIDSIMSTNSNLTQANSRLNSKLESMTNFIISANSSQAAVNSNLDLKINSIMSTNSNLTIANSNIKNDLQFIKENFTNSITHQDAKLDSIREHQGCPKGTFLFAPSNQCFRVLGGGRTWNASKAACKSLGLELATVYDAISLRSYLVQKYTLLDFTWLGARAVGNIMKWERTGVAIAANNPLWWPGRPANHLSHGICLALLTHQNHWQQNHNRTYFNLPNNWARSALCEHVME